jgi:type VI secretion system protein ImpA
VLDLQQLLAPISGDAPCGKDLEYDAAYLALEAAARGKPEGQVGDEPAVPPDWQQVEQAALDLLRRSADIRLAVYLARAQLRPAGFPGFASFADALSVIHGLLDQRWEAVYPLIEEDGDVTLRVNAVAAIAQKETQYNTDTIERAVRLVPLVDAPRVGHFSLRDCQIASGRLSPLPGAAAIAANDINEAFNETPLEEVQATAAAVRRCIATATAIEGVVTERVGAAQAADLSPLVEVLREAEKVLSEQLERRGAPVPLVVTTGPVRRPAAVEGNGAAAPQPLTGEITSREEIARMLDKACEYFHRHEPSSPVPLLLERAKRLMSKDFVEILRDVAPDAVTQFEIVSGVNRQNEA